MVLLATVQASNKVLVISNSLVAVFVGATTGIGSNTVKELARTHGASKSTKSLRVYIIGRNSTAAEEIFIECRKSCPKGTFIFVNAIDLALMRDVDVACEELTKIEKSVAQKAGEIARIDILCMSQAIFKPSTPRIETKEGLDTFMSLLYYSRMRFVTQLTPLLLASTLPARVISVFGARDDKLIPEDLSLRDPTNYGFMSSGSHAGYFKTFFMEYLAAQHPRRLSLVHYYPGLVFTHDSYGADVPIWVWFLLMYCRPLLRLFPMTLSAEENGQRVLFNASGRFPARDAVEKGVLESEDGLKIAEASDGIVGGGAYRVTYNNEMIATPARYVKMREEGWEKKVVDHTLKAFEVIGEGKAFTE